MRSVEDIRALVDPQGYIDSLEQVKTLLAGNLSRILVDYDLTEASPNLAAETKQVELARILNLMMDVKWRIEEIDRRVEAARNGAMGRQPNRAERRKKRS